MRRLRKLSGRRIACWLRGEIDRADLFGLDDDVRADLLDAAKKRFDAGERAEAEKIYHLIVELWPLGSADALNGIGACRQGAGLIKSAISFYTKAIEDRPNDPFALANRAECLLLQDQREEARADLERAMKTHEAKMPAALRERITALISIAESSKTGV